MKVTGITKEAMFKLVKCFSSDMNGIYKDDYFAMAKDVDSCKFVLEKNKAVLKFKGVEIFPDDVEGVGEETEHENYWETTATLYLDGEYDDYMKSYFFTLEVFEDIKVYGNIDGCEKLDDLSGSIYFNPGEILLSECGIEVAG